MTRGSIALHKPAINGATAEMASCFYHSNISMPPGTLTIKCFLAEVVMRKPNFTEETLKIGLELLLWSLSRTRCCQRQDVRAPQS